ncbi:class II aldolase/adducin family protein [Paraburkholderia sediminicola]|uniref:class II aldolase/adducin family protein n=1 Tax=Paraburkholderia sediminicola TaxID=458836 RepID=UPI0038BDDC3F
MTRAEWSTRCDLAALYRLLDHFRMTDLIDTHISARVPGPEQHFLINRYGVLFHEMRASDLVRVDYRGDVVTLPGGDAARAKVNAAGFTIHSAVHVARPDLHCVIHTHTAAGMAVAAQRDGLLPISQHALKFYGRVAYHDYEGVALDLDERARLVADLGQANVMILRNHGLLAAGRTIGAAFREIYMLERACQAQVQALAGGQTLSIPPVHVCEKTAAQFGGCGADEFAAFAWQSALRLLEPGAPDYRS